MDETERSLAEDTLPLFVGDEFEIYDWARNEMNWEDVRDHAVFVGMRDKKVNFIQEWMDADVEIIRGEL